VQFYWNIDPSKIIEENNFYELVLDLPEKEEFVNYIRDNSDAINFERFRNILDFLIEI